MARSCTHSARTAATARLAASALVLACLVVAPASGQAARLWDDRFEVRVTWTDPGGATAPAEVSSAGGQSAVFHFYRADNPELLVKILDGRALNGHFWVLYGAITTLELDIEVRDVASGGVRVYHKAPGLPLGGADSQAFAEAGQFARVPVLSRRPPTAKVASAGPCVPDATSLCLQDGRFLVRAAWQADPASARQSFAGVVPTSDQSGYLWFFDQGNAEVLVKVLDGRPVNGAFWVLFGSATHVPFELRVSDLDTGVERTFTSGPFAGGADAFTFGALTDLPAPPQILLPREDAQVEVSPYEPALVIRDAAGTGCLDYQIDELVVVEGDDTGSQDSWLPIWETRCTGGALRILPDLDLGTFTYASSRGGVLRADTRHRLRARRRVGDLTGPWTERAFATGPESAVYRAPVRPLAEGTQPAWTVGGEPVRLPDTTCRLRVLASDEPLVTFGSQSAGGEARALVSAGTSAADSASQLWGRWLRVVADDCVRHLQLSASEVRWQGADGRPVTVYLPALDLLLGQLREFDVAEGGSTFGIDPFRRELATTDPARLVRHSPAPWHLAPGLRIERVATDRGFALPVNLTAGPTDAAGVPIGPAFYVTELYGTIRTVATDGSVGTYAEGLLNFNPFAVLPGRGEVGLAGTLVEPASGDLLVSTVYADGTLPDGSPFLSGKVLRLESDDGGWTLARASTVLDFGPGTRLTHAHQISHLSFGSDGMLYVNVGDGFRPQAAQDVDDFRGKVLRLHLDGSAPEDNPFYDASDGIGAADYVYALGFRNPFGGDWRSADGRYYTIEAGPSVDRFARIRRGTNYGWGADGDGTDEQMATGAIFNWPRPATPFDLVFLDHVSDSLPAAWAGRALVSEFGPTYRFGRSLRGKRLALFDLDAAGWPREVPGTILRYAGLGPATVAAMVAVAGTPDRDGVYFVDFFPEPVDQNSDPTAAAARLWRVTAAPTP